MPSELYTRLQKTADLYLHGGDSENGYSAVSMRAPECLQSWGHRYMVSQRPELQPVLTNDGFEEYGRNIGQYITSIRSETKEIIVDEDARKVVATASYWVDVEGEGVGDVENELVWVFHMDETGEKVKKAVEYVDGDASRKVNDALKRAAEKAGKTKSS